MVAGMPSGMQQGLPGGMSGSMPGVRQPDVPAFGGSVQQVQDLFESFGGSVPQQAQQPPPVASRAPKRDDDCPFGPGPRNNTMSLEALVTAGIVQPESSDMPQ